VVVHQQGHAGNLIDELIRHGESLKVVQKRFGHKSAVETLDTYSHLCRT
jgi:site-specific recombinase XerD